MPRIETDCGDSLHTRSKNVHGRRGNRLAEIAMDPPGDSGFLISLSPCREYILGRHMRTKLWLVAALVALLSAPAYADKRSDAKAQVAFGIKAAQITLWKEAVYRFEKAIEIDPTYGGAWNDLGIAYEQLGRFDEARKAYEKALEIEPNNTFIRNNYDLFREIYDRQNRRRDK